MHLWHHFHALYWRYPARRQTVRKSRHSSVPGQLTKITTIQSETENGSGQLDAQTSHGCKHKQVFFHRYIFAHYYALRERGDVNICKDQLSPNLPPPHTFMFHPQKPQKNMSTSWLVAGSCGVKTQLWGKYLHMRGGGGISTSRVVISYTFMNSESQQQLSTSWSTPANSHIKL